MNKIRIAFHVEIKKRRERREGGEKNFLTMECQLLTEKNDVRKIPNLLSIVIIIIIAIIDGSKKSQFSSFLPGFRRGSMQSWE